MAFTVVRPERGFNRRLELARTNEKTVLALDSSDNASCSYMSIVNRREYIHSRLIEILISSSWLSVCGLDIVNKSCRTFLAGQVVRYTSAAGSSSQVKQSSVVRERCVGKRTTRGERKSGERQGVHIDVHFKHRQAFRFRATEKLPLVIDEWKRIRSSLESLLLNLDRTRMGTIRVDQSQKDASRSTVLSDTCVRVVNWYAKRRE